MTDYTFRLRFTLPNSEKIEIADSNIVLNRIDGTELVLSSGDPQIPISASDNLILRGSGYKSEEEADLEGRRQQGILIRSLAKLGIGVDFGMRATKSGLTKVGLTMLANGGTGRVLNDIHGLMVFNSLPNPLFASVGHPKVIIGTKKERFTKIYALAVDNNLPLSERELLAFDVFSASFFQYSVDARFLMLIMAIEILITPTARSLTTQKHIEYLIQLTIDNPDLPTEERQSIRGSLRWLLSESIGQAGRRLVIEQLNGRNYMEKPATKFFTHCYNLRSQLVHGNVPLPERVEIGNTIGSLERFVADLLSGPLLNFEI